MIKGVDVTPKTHLVLKQAVHLWYHTLSLATEVKHIIWSVIQGYKQAINMFRMTTVA